MATHIKDLLKTFLEEKSKTESHYTRLAKSVEEYVDADLRNRVHFAGQKKTTLLFYTDASSVLYEFNLKKGMLLAALKKDFPSIEGIHISIRAPHP
ncbi:MAG: hypothetical protein ABH865_02460 [Candidatus Omnitrophota bacterium]|nr:hypothetical protein [Candidatus Omnitrophota bacterium]